METITAASTDPVTSQLEIAKRDVGIERNTQTQADSSRSKAGRVLIIDDEESIRNALKRFLRRSDRQIFTFSSATPCSRCRCRVGEACADVILSDVSMPGLRGVDFVENQRRVGCTVPSIGLMSGAWSDGDRSRAQALGCRIFSKPFDLDELSTWVDESSRLGERVLAGHFFKNTRQQNPNHGLRVQTPKEPRQPAQVGRLENDIGP